MLQKSQPPFAAGDVVTVRGRRWLVEEAVALADCTLLRLAASGACTRGADCTLLHPFDRPVRFNRALRVRAVTRRRWMHVLHSHLAECRTFGQLRAAQSANIEIFPFQLEPVLALIRGLASRVLLADEVGLGKTIQAGLMLAELRHRGWCERALILAPAGLREQWADELTRRFNIRAPILDAPSLRAMTAALPVGLNPWTVEPVAIASIDFIKQPEVLRALTSVVWDMLVVDEAHQVPTAPQRAAAVGTLAEHARHVVLLTATPHAGDDTAYRSLCSIGQLGHTDRIVLFRRSRRDVGLAGARRVHLLPVRLSDEEYEMHRLLGEYVRRVWKIGKTQNRADLQLVATVLSKRAFSSASSLAVSLERRLTMLSTRIQPPLQSALPFDEDDRSDAEPALATPAFDHIDEERAALERILAIAERARLNERKIHALRRLLGRIQEPAIAFTEYRDTLSTLEDAVRPLRHPALLHGGMNRLQRRAAVEAFATGAADLLLATDAGSEGLNLQSRCRVVINLELPWNPVRLEQRIGRVDRLGQSRTVHAIHLFARDTAESTVLAGLIRRLDCIRRSLPSFDNPVISQAETDIASAVIQDTEVVFRAQEEIAAVPTLALRLRTEAETEGARLRLRSMTGTSAPAARQAQPSGIPVTTLHTSAASGLESPGVLFFVRARVTDAAGRLLEDILVPVRLPVQHSIRVRRRTDLRAHGQTLFDRFEPAVMAAVQEHIARRTTRIGSEYGAGIQRALAREHQLAEARSAKASDSDRLVQAGLFDRRSLNQHEADRQRWTVSSAESDSRVEALRSGLVALSPQRPEPVLLLIVEGRT